MEESLKTYINEHILSKIPANCTNIVMMDFDECAVAGHLSRIITEACQRELEKKPEIEAAKNDNSRKSLYLLSSVFTGITRNSIDKVIAQCCQRIAWRNGVEAFLTSGARKREVQFIWVSSGIYEAIAQKQQELQRKPLIIASYLSFTNDKVTGTPFVVTDKDKGQVARYIRKAKSSCNIMTIGHSSGDIPLVKNGDRGLRIAFRDKNALLEVADVVINYWDWNSLKPFIENM